MAIQDTVREKLQSQIVKDLIQKRDIHTLRAVYAKLLEMDPGNKGVLSALDQLEKMEQASETQKKADYFKNADQTIAEFIKKGDLVDAQQATLEMLSYYPENKHYQGVLRSIENKQTQTYNKGLKSFFPKAQAELTQEYASNKEAFIRI